MSAESSRSALANPDEGLDELSLLKQLFPQIEEPILLETLKDEGSYSGAVDSLLASLVIHYSRTSTLLTVSPSKLGLHASRGSYCRMLSESNGFDDEEPQEDRQLQQLQILRDEEIARALQGETRWALALGQSSLLRSQLFQEDPWEGLKKYVTDVYSYVSSEVSGIAQDLNRYITESSVDEGGESCPQGSSRDQAASMAQSETKKER